MTSEKARTATTLIGVATRAKEFKTFLKAAAAADLLDTLRNEGPFTLMAPTDDAFEALAPEVLAKLFASENAAQLRTVLGYHFAAGKVLSSRFAGKVIRARTFEGRDWRIDGRDGLTVDRANVVAPDIIAANGVLHGIDAVLWPKAAATQTRITAGAA